MPPDLSIAGGEDLPVRGEVFWTSKTTNKKPIIATSDIKDLQNGTRDNLAVVSPGSIDSNDSEEDVTSGSSDSEASEFSSAVSSASESDYPPSPPTFGKLSLIGTSPAPSVVSSVASDYFSSKSTIRKNNFLEDVFPRSKLLTSALKVASEDGTWQLAMTEEAGARVLYAKSSVFEETNLRENLVALLDRADEELDCDQVVVVLDKHDTRLSSILHSLLYVGGVVISRSSACIHGKHASSCVLVGIEL